MEGSQNGASGSNNSSDFVRKLYKMLEDPSYSSVVRWGDDLDSFVVLENEKFTKSILPKHFKHSNFASFVRQLNKYDFHKVRHNNEENGASPYGSGAWEFKHPEFKANNKDALDNIRRKAPAPRKPTQMLDDAMPTHQMDMFNTQLMAMQQQLQQLQERYNQLSLDHHMLLSELIGVQKTVVNHDQVLGQVMQFLQRLDSQRRRESKIGGGMFGQQHAAAASTANVSGNGQAGPVGDGSTGFDDEEPASPLQHASKLLSDFNAEVQLNFKNLEQMNEMHHRNIIMGNTPSPSARVRVGTSGGSSAVNVPPYKMDDNLDNLVYPVGQTNGIDPMYSEHISNIPYPMPAQDGVSPDSPMPMRKKSSAVDPGWVRQPRILLVEDDQTCRRIGTKFILSFNCALDHAPDGLEAVNKLNNSQKYDLILMDIIMPNLDGVSACHLIRQFDNTPIIAMTSNIRSDDIAMYFQHGMNDVLPKPFTKDGLYQMLDKHLGRLKKMSTDGVDLLPTSASTMAATSNSLSLKDDSSPGASPSTMSNWNSPQQFSGISPATSQGGHFIPPQLPNHAPPPGPAYAPQGPGIEQHAANNMQYSSNRGIAGPPTAHRRAVSDMSGGVDDMGNDPKRPRIYAQTNAAMGAMRGR